MNKLKAIILTVATLVFTSCEKDSYDDTSNNGNLKVSKVSLKDPLVQKNTKLIQEAEKIKSKQQSLSSGKIVYDSINDFYLDDEKGVLIEDENGHKSYTFKVYRDKPTEKLENIVFNLKEDSSYEALLTTYDLNEIEKEKLLNGETFTPTETPDISIVGKVTDPECDTVIDHCTAVYMDGVVYYVVTYANPCPQGSGGSGSPNGSSGTGSNTGGSSGSCSTGYTPLPTLPTGTTQGSSTSGSGTVLTTPVGGGGSSIGSMPLTDRQSNFLRDLGFLREEFSQLNVNVAMPVLNYINTCNATQYMSALNYFRSLNYMWLSEQTDLTQASAFQYLIQNNFASANVNLVNQMVNSTIADPSAYASPEGVQTNNLALQITLSLLATNNVSNFGNSAADNIIKPQLDAIDPGFGTAGAGFMAKYNALVIQEAAMIMLNDYPDGHQFTAFEIANVLLQAQAEAIHLLFDIAGMAPVVGPIFDATNGVWYTFSGDFVNGGLSFASAVPFIGDWTAVARVSKRVYVFSNSGRKVILKSYKLVDGTIVFSNRAQLRKLLNITNSAIHAHHIIPYSLVNNRLVQKAAKFASDAKKAWHPNDITNGIAIPADFHLNGHAAYLEIIREHLAILDTRAGDNLELAWDYLTQYTAQIKTLIENNPNLTLGEIALLIRTP
ncbi:AHH domain-containing protein [Flavobacterium amniphilum]|uniref:AHH domain-containing protein n=1 Tax=Flavobacterium amniphilum TaxID=1834035 RepID=UPI00202A9B6D|nr:AHH domain-containing protein [Flavobacterium amniphilum]MCL9807685.1 AHH domain-containing protein [Flavobacterium amniphilum]